MADPVWGSMSEHPLGKALTSLGTLSSRPSAFLIVIAYAVLWFVLDRKSLDMHGIATLLVWFMTLFIQRAEHRDTQAIHAKLDELVRAEGGARDELADIDRKEPEQIEAQRERESGAARR